ncbi:Uncharacterised protein [uncultured archaeon]|nr:Uncharacterised protein [uncultured archaeon]
MQNENSKSNEEKNYNEDIEKRLKLPQWILILIKISEEAKKNDANK